MDNTDYLATEEDTIKYSTPKQASKSKDVTWQKSLSEALKKNRLDYSDALEQSNLKLQQDIMGVELSAKQKQEEIELELDKKARDSNVEIYRNTLQGRLEGKDARETMIDNYHKVTDFEANRNYLLNEKLPLANKHSLETLTKSHNDELAQLGLKFRQANNRVMKSYDDMIRDLNDRQQNASSYKDFIDKFYSKNEINFFELAYQASSNNRYDATTRIRTGLINTSVGSLIDGFIHLGDNTINGVAHAFVLGANVFGANLKIDEVKLIEDISRYFGWNFENYDNIEAKYFDFFDRVNLTMSLGHILNSIPEIGVLVTGYGATKYALTSIVTRNINKINKAIKIAEKSNNTALVNVLTQMKQNLKNFNPNKSIKMKDWYSAMGSAIGSSSSNMSRLRVMSALGLNKRGAVAGVGGLITLASLLMGRVAEQKKLSGNDSISLSDFITGLTHLSLDLMGGLFSFGLFKNSKSFFGMLNEPGNALLATNSRIGQGTGFFINTAGSIATEAVTEGLQGYLESLAMNQYALPSLDEILFNREAFYNEHKQITESAYIGGMSGGITHATVGIATNYFYNKNTKAQEEAKKRFSEAQIKANESFNDTEFNETYKDDIYQDVKVKQNERANRIRNSEIEIEDKDGNKTKINAPLQNSNQRTIAELEKQEKDVSKQIKEKQDELVREQAKQKPNEKSDAVKQLEQEIDELIKKKEDVQNLKKEYETFEEVNQSLLASRTANALYNEVGDKLLEDGKTKKEFDEVVSKISKAETAEQRKEAVDEFIDIIKITDNMKKEIAKTLKGVRSSSSKYKWNRNPEPKSDKKSKTEQIKDKASELYQKGKEKLSNTKNKKKDDKSDKDEGETDTTTEPKEPNNPNLDSNTEIKGNEGSSEVTSDQIVEVDVNTSNTSTIEEEIENITDENIDTAIKTENFSDDNIRNYLKSSDQDLAMYVLSKQLSKMSNANAIAKEWESKFQLLSIDTKDVNFQIFGRHAYRKVNKKDESKITLGRTNLYLIRRDATFIDSNGEVQSLFIDEGSTLQKTIQNAINESRNAFKEAQNILINVNNNTLSLTDNITEISKIKRQNETLLKAYKKEKNDDKKAYIRQEIIKNKEKIKNLQAQNKNIHNIIYQNLSRMEESINRDLGKIADNLTYFMFLMTRGKNQTLTKDLGDFAYSLNVSIQNMVKDFKNIRALGTKIGIEIEDITLPNQSIQNFGISENFEAVLKSTSKIFAPLKRLFGEFNTKFELPNQHMRLNYLANFFKRLGKYFSKLDDVFNETKNMKLKTVLNGLGSLVAFSIQQSLFNSSNLNMINNLDGSNVEIDLTLANQISEAFQPFLNLIRKTNETDITNFLLDSIIKLATLNKFDLNIVSNMLIPLKQVKIPINKIREIRASKYTTATQNETLEHNNEVTLYDLLMLPQEAISKIFALEEIEEIGGLEPGTISRGKDGQAEVSVEIADRVRSQLRQYIADNIFKANSPLQKQIVEQLVSNNDIIAQLDTLLNIGLIVRAKTLIEDSIKDSDLEAYKIGTTRKVFGVTLLKKKEFARFKKLLDIDEINDDIANSLYQLSSFMANEYFSQLVYGEGDKNISVYKVGHLEFKESEKEDTSKNFILVRKSFIKDITHNFNDIFDAIFEKEDADSFQYITNDLTPSKKVNKKIPKHQQNTINILDNNHYNINEEDIDTLFSEILGVKLPLLLHKILSKDAIKVNSKEFSKIVANFVSKKENKKQILALPPDKQVANPLMYMPLITYKKKEGTDIFVKETTYIFMPSLMSNPKVQEQLSISKDIYKTFKNDLDSEIDKIMSRMKDITSLIYIKGNQIYNQLLDLEKQNKINDSQLALLETYKIFDGRINFNKKFRIFHKMIKSSNRIYTKDGISNGITNKVIRNLLTLQNLKQKGHFDINSPKTKLNLRLAFVQIFGLDVDKIKLTEKGVKALEKALKKYETTRDDLLLEDTPRAKQKLEKAKQEFLDKVDKIYGTEEIYSKNIKTKIGNNLINISKLFSNLMSEDNTIFEKAAKEFTTLIESGTIDLNTNLFDDHPFISKRNYQVFKNYINNRIQSIKDGNNKKDYFNVLNDNNLEVYIDGASTAIFQNMIRYTNISTYSSMMRVYNIDEATLITLDNLAKRNLKTLSNAERARVNFLYKKLLNTLNFYSRNTYNKLVEEKGIDPYIMTLALFQHQMSKLALGNSLVAKLISQLDSISRDEIKEIIMPYLYSSSIKSVINKAFHIAISKHNKEFYSMLEEFEETTDISNLKTTEELSISFIEFIKNKHRARVDNVKNLFTDLSRFINTLPNIYSNKKRKDVNLNNTQKSNILLMYAYFAKKYKDYKIIIDSSETRIENNTIFINEEDTQDTKVLESRIRRELLLSIKQEDLIYNDTNEVLDLEETNKTSKMYFDLITLGNIQPIKDIFANSLIITGETPYIYYNTIELNIADLRNINNNKQDKELKNGIFMKDFENLLHYIQVFDLTKENTPFLFGDKSFTEYWKKIADLIAPMNEYHFPIINPVYFEFFKSLDKDKYLNPENFIFDGSEYITSGATKKWIESKVSYYQKQLKEKTKKSDKEIEKLVKKRRKDLNTIAINVYNMLFYTGEFLPEHSPLYNKLSTPDLNIARQQSLLTKKMKSILQKNIVDGLAKKLNNVIIDVFEESGRGQFTPEALQLALNDASFYNKLIKEMNKVREDYYKAIYNSLLNEHQKYFPFIFTKKPNNQQFTEYFQMLKETSEKIINSVKVDAENLYSHLYGLAEYLETNPHLEMTKSIIGINKISFNTEGKLYTSTFSSTFLSTEEQYILPHILDLFNHNLEAGIMGEIVQKYQPKLQIYDGWTIQANNAIDSILTWDEFGPKIFSEYINVPSMFQTILNTIKESAQISSFGSDLRFSLYNILYSIELSQKYQPYVENINIGTEASVFRNTKNINKEYTFVRETLKRGILLFKQARAQSKQTDEQLKKFKIFDIFNEEIDVKGLIDILTSSNDIDYIIDTLLDFYKFFANKAERKFKESILLDNSPIDEQTQKAIDREAQKRKIAKNSKAKESSPVTNENNVPISKNVIGINKLLDWESSNTIRIKIGGKLVSFRSIRHAYEAVKSGVFNETAYNNANTHGVYENNEDNKEEISNRILYTNNAQELKDALMTRDSSLSIVIWDGQSPGSLNNIKRAKELNKPVVVFNLINNNKELEFNSEISSISKEEFFKLVREHNKRIFISGSRNTNVKSKVASSEKVITIKKIFELVSQKNKNTILVGDAVGIDSEIITTANKTKTPVTIYTISGPKTRLPHLKGDNDVEVVSDYKQSGHRAKLEKIVEKAFNNPVIYNELVKNKFFHNMRLTHTNTLFEEVVNKVIEKMKKEYQAKHNINFDEEIKTEPIKVLDDLEFVDDVEVESTQTLKEEVKPQEDTTKNEIDDVEAESNEEVLYIDEFFDEIFINHKYLDYVTPANEFEQKIFDFIKESKVYVSIQDIIEFMDSLEVVSDVEMYKLITLLFSKGVLNDADYYKIKRYKKDYNFKAISSYDIDTNTFVFYSLLDNSLNQIFNINPSSKTEQKVKAIKALNSYIEESNINTDLIDGEDTGFEIKGNQDVYIDSNKFFAYKLGNQGKQLSQSEVQSIIKEGEHLSKREFKKYLIKAKERALKDKSLTEVGKQAIALSYDTIINLIDNVENLNIVLSDRYNEQLGIEVVEKNSRNITLILFSNQKNETALHELTHSVMEFAFNESSNEVNNLKQEINKIRLQIQSELENNYKLRQELGISEEQFNYIFKNINGTNRILHEFTATFISNPKLAEYLANRKYNGTMFTRFQNLRGNNLIGKGISLLKALIAFSYDLVTFSLLKNNVNLHSKLLNIISKMSEFNTLESVKQKTIEYENRKLVKANKAFKNILHIATRNVFMSVDTYVKNKDISEEDVKTYKQEILESTKKARASLYSTVNAMSETDNVALKALYTIIGLLKATFTARGVLSNPIKRNMTLDLLNDYKQQLFEGTIFDFKIPFDLNLIYDKGLKKLKNSIDQILSFNTAVIRENEHNAYTIKEEIKNIIYNKKYKNINRYIRNANSLLDDNSKFEDKYEKALTRIIYNLKVSDYFIGDTILKTSDINKLINRLLFNDPKNIQAETNSLTYQVLNTIINSDKETFEELKKSHPDVYQRFENYIKKSTKDLAFTRLTMLNNKFGLQNAEEIFYNIADIYKLYTNKDLKISNEAYIGITQSLHKMVTLNAIDLSHQKTLNKDISYIADDIQVIRDMYYEYNTITYEGINKDITSLLGLLINAHFNSEKRMTQKRVLNPNIAFEYYKEGKNITDKIFLDQNIEPIVLSKNTLKYEETKKELLDKGFKKIKEDSKSITLQIPSAYNIIGTFNRGSRPFYKEGYIPHDMYNPDMSVISLNRGTDNFTKNLQRYLDMGYEEFHFSDEHNKFVTKDTIFLKYKGINNYKTPVTQMGYHFEGRQASGKVWETEITKEALRKDKYLGNLYNEMTSTELSLKEFYSSDNTRRLAGSTSKVRTNISLRGYEELMESNNSITNIFFNQELQIGKNMTKDLINNQTMYSIIQSNEIIKQRKMGKGINSEHHHAIALFSVEQDAYGNYTIEQNTELVEKYDISFNKDDITALKRLLKTINYDVRKDGELIYVDTRLLPMYFGYQKPHLNDVAKEGKLQRIISGVATLLREAISEIRNNIIIRNPSLVFENFKSNAIGLIGEGISINEIFSSVPIIAEQMSEYKHLEKVKKEIETKLNMLNRNINKESVLSLKNKLQKDLYTVTKNIKEHSMKKFFDAGFYTNLIQDSEAVSRNLDTKLIQKIVNKLNLSDTTEAYLNEVLLTSSSETYNALAEATRVGDFVPRVIYYNHLVSNLGKSHQEALDMAREKFVNYNTPLWSPVLKWLDYYGFTNFIKYKTAIQKQVLLAFANNPIQASAIVGLQMASVAMKIKNPFLPSSYLLESMLIDGNLPSGLLRDSFGNFTSNLVRYNNIL